MPERPWIYHNLAVHRGGSVDKYLRWVRETHMLPTWEATIAYLIEMLDPDWDLARGQK